MTKTIVYVAPEKVQASFTSVPRETLQEMSDRIALEYKIPTTTLHNLVTGESQWNPRAVSSTGDYGLVQLNLASFPGVTEEQAYDPEFSLRFAAKKISEGKEYLWTVCSCVQFAKALGVKIPRGLSAWDLLPNTTPGIGKLVLINGNHVAVITKIEGTGFWVREANWRPCTTGSRFILWNSKSIRGFWDG